MALATSDDGTFCTFLLCFCPTDLGRLVDCDDQLKRMADDKDDNDGDEHGRDGPVAVGGPETLQISRKAKSLLLFAVVIKYDLRLLPKP